MPRALRHVPPGSLVSVTTRTVGGRFLLRPSRDLNDIAHGLMARAARLYDVRVCAYNVLSNHQHALLLPGDGERLTRFMEYFNGNLAREAGRLHDWHERFWGRRFHHAIVSEEPEAQIERLKYILGQGPRDLLVRKAEDWPGASSVQAQLTGQIVRGLWFDRTAQGEAQRCHRPFSKYEFATEESLALTPIPCWAHLPEEEIRKRTAELVREIEAEARERLDREGRSPMGRRRILNQHPHDRPKKKLEPTPAPLFHTATREVRQSLRHAYREFRAAFRQAAEDLKAGEPNPEFPPYCFPPHLPFRRPPPRAGPPAANSPA